MNEPIYHLIHANIALMRADFEDPIMAGFLARVDEIDVLASNSPGFVAQPELADEGVEFSGRNLLNISIWESLESLERFTYQGRHADALDHRSEWFVQNDKPNYVLYWAPAGQVPSEVEIKVRLDYLIRYGSTPYVFTFNQPFTVQEMLDYEPERE